MSITLASFDGLAFQQFHKLPFRSGFFILCEGARMGVDKNAVELARKILEAASRDQSAVEFDDLLATTVRSLSLITAGDAIEFSDQQQPPLEVMAWLYEADLPHVRGLLFETLYRWHELRQAK